MEAKSTNEKSKITKLHENDENYGNFQGKISYIFRLVFTTINLCLSESYVQNKNKLIEHFNELFESEEKEMAKTLNKFIIVDLYNNLGEINQAENPLIIECISSLGEFIRNKITLEDLFDKTTNNLNKLIELVKKNGSKPTSIKIINQFYDYTNDHLDKLIKLKIISNPKTRKEEEKVKDQQIQYENKIDSLMQQLKEKDLELNNLNDKFINESLDKNSYKEDNQILMNKIKEMDKKIDAMSLQFAEKEKRTNLQIEKMKKRMDELSLISFENKKKCDELFQILRQNLNLIRRLEIITQELVVDHNNLVNLTMN